MAYASIIASLAGAGLAAGGQIGGGLLGASGGGGRTSISGGFDPGSDPLLAAASLDALLPFGVVDPRILQQSSPLQQAIASFQRSQQGRQNVNKAIATVNQIVSRVIAGEDYLQVLADVTKKSKKLRKRVKGFTGSRDDLVAEFEQDKLLQKFLGHAGYGSLQQLIDAETNFQQSLPGRLEGLDSVASTLREAQVGAMLDRANLISNLPDVSATGLENTRNAERDLLLSQLDDIQRDALRQAQISGINPGRQLAELDEFRATDLELQALNRAVGLLSGEQSLAASGLGILDVAIGQPSQTASGLGALRIGGQGNTSFSSPIQPNTLGAGLAGAGATLGNTVASLPELLRDAGLLSTRPAVD